MKKSIFTSYVDSINKELEKEEANLRKEIAKDISKQMKINVSQVGTSLPGQYPKKVSGDLQKGITYRGNDPERSRTSLVGFQSPGHHAHLLEFGHGTGKEKNKRPFFRKTFDEMGEYIAAKMREPWLTKKEFTNV